MTLFFETSHQSISFLLCVPIGFAIALGLGSENSSGWMRIVLDLLVLSAGALGFLVLFVCTNDGGMRVYHLAGALCGALLYLLGFYRLQKGIKRRLKRKLRCKSAFQAGKTTLETE